MDKKEKFKGQGIPFPIVDFNKCSGAGLCIPACPFDVFELKLINETDKKGLYRVGKFKIKFNSKKAYVVQADLCNA
jgi:4Fe-4S ferredoxin